MEVTVTQENLTNALASASRIANTKTDLPILNNILLRTDGARLLVAATNLEISVTHTIGAKVIKPGSITVPARIVNDFVHNLSKGQLTLTVNGTKLHIKSEASSSIFNGVADDEFPELPMTDNEKSISYALSTDDFKQSVAQTTIAASGDATRPVLTGVYWHSYDNKLYLAGTDGYRLAERQVVATKSDVSAIIPVSTLQEVLRTLRDDTGEVNVLFTESQVSFRLEGVEIISRLIDGNFPDYRQLIPSTTETTFSIGRSDFVRVIKIAGLFARDSGGGITLVVDTDKSVLTINSIASEFGENSSEVKVEISGESASVSLNSRYLLDALGAVSSDRISFGFSGKLAPCVLTESLDNPAYKHIVMPLKS